MPVLGASLDQEMEYSWIFTEHLESSDTKNYDEWTYCTPVMIRGPIAPVMMRGPIVRQL